VEPPEHVDEEWRRDLPGSDKPPQGVGEQTWKISHALAVVPPEHWEERFGLRPSELVAAANGDWEAALLKGWCEAAKQYGEKPWAWALWKHHYETLSRDHYWVSLPETALSLAPLLSQVELAMDFGRMVRDDGMTVRLAATIMALPGLWDEGLYCQYLEELRSHVSEVYVKSSEGKDHWWWTLRAAAERMPPSCFEHTSATLLDVAWTEHEEGQMARQEPYLRRLREELRNFEETLDLRRKLVEEILL